MQTVALFIQVR